MIPRSPVQLEPVSTAAERRLRKKLYRNVVLILVIAAAMIACLSILNTPRPLAVFLPGLFVGNIWTIWIAIQLSNAHTDARKTLRAANYKRCPVCEYDLGGLPDSGVCPECCEPYTPDLLKAKWERSYNRMLDKPGR